MTRGRLTLKCQCTCPLDMMELALDFYERLNNLEDEFLEKNNYAREEIEQGLKEIAKEFGVSLI